MTASKLILSVLVAGPLCGTLLGVTTTTAMLPPPEPTWRLGRPAPTYTGAQQWIDAGPQDLSPYAYVDRTPTWKRRALEQEAALAMREAEYAPEPAIPPPEPLPEPAAAPPPQAAPRDAMATAPPQAAPRDAMATAPTMAQPAIVEPARDEAEASDPAA